MIRAIEKDRDLAVEILSQSFGENKSVNFVIQQNYKKIHRLIGYCFDVGMEQGDVFFSNDKNAVAILLFPERKKTTIKSIWRDIKLVLNVVGIGRVMAVMNRETLIKKKQPKEPFIHLWYIGVFPEESGKGIGSLLLNDIIGYCNTKNRDIYLETSTERNIEFYTRNGFLHFDTIVEGLPYELMLFKRKKD